MKQNEISKFRGLLKALDVVYIIAISLTGLGIGIITLLTLFLSMKSEATINQFLMADNSKLRISIGGKSYELTHQFIRNHLEVDKEMLLGMLLLGILNLILTLLFVWCARKLIKAFKNDQFFNNKNGTYIEYIAVIVLILGHTYQFMVSMIAMLITQSINLDEFLREHDMISNVQYQLNGIKLSVILVAVTIWFIGRAFKYGAFLQEEYDATV